MPCTVRSERVGRVRQRPEPYSLSYRIRPNQSINPPLQARLELSPFPPRATPIFLFLVLSRLRPCPLRLGGRADEPRRYKKAPLLGNAPKKVFAHFFFSREKRLVRGSATVLLSVPRAGGKKVAAARALWCALCASACGAERTVGSAVSARIECAAIRAMVVTERKKKTEIEDARIRGRATRRRARKKARARVRARVFESEEGAREGRACVCAEEEREADVWTLERGESDHEENDANDANTRFPAPMISTVIPSENPQLTASLSVLLPSLCITG